MSKPAKCIQLLQKSINAAIAAIEIYNKPNFEYREESFCILMTNSWELLLKGKLLSENRNNVREIYIKENVLKKNGIRGAKKVYKKNRCGNEITIDLFKALSILQHKYGTEINDACKNNLELLIEIRDNAVHFFNTDPEFTKKVMEVGTANLRSYITYVQQWFEYDLSKYNFFLMPISFFHSFEVESFSVNKREKQMKKLLDYIRKKEDEVTIEGGGPHYITLRFETRFVKSKAQDVAEVRYTNNPNAPAVRVLEEDVIASKYPLNYKRLSHKLRERYVNFKMDTKYHKLRRTFEGDNRFCRKRLLDPQNQNSSSQKFYSTEILKEFDLHYTKA